MKIKLLLSLFIISMFLFAGCSTSDASSPEKISAREAKKMLEETKDIILLDVRTLEEYEAGHIEGAILLPDYDVEEKAELLLEDKKATILIYCRSGRRSALAAKTLSELGYTSVYDFGGIIDWPYDIVD